MAFTGLFDKLGKLLTADRSPKMLLPSLEAAALMVDDILATDVLKPDNWLANDDLEREKGARILFSGDPEASNEGAIDLAPSADLATKLLSNPMMALISFDLLLPA